MGGMKKQSEKKRKGKGKPRTKRDGASGSRKGCEGSAGVRGSRSRQGGNGGRLAARAEAGAGAGAKAGFASAPESKCPVSAKCGGCSLIDVPYEEQLAEKQQFVVRLFEGVALEDAVVEPVLGMEEPYHYRAKVVSPFAPGRKLAGDAGRSTAGSAGNKGLRDREALAANRRYGKDGRPLKGKGARKDARAGAGAPLREILTGMYAAHSHRLVPTDECLLENRRAKAVILAVRDLMYRFGMDPYDEDAGVGFMRHAVVRVGHKSGEVLVTLVTNAREFPASRSFSRELVKRCPFVTTVVQNVNLRQTNVILGDEERTLFGPGFILDTLCGLSFRISSKSFYQVNAVQTEVLYRCAIELAGLTGTETVIDAYCGTGTIGLVAAKCGAARVIGVDSVASAIRDARQNARHNGVENAEFVAADAADFMRELAARNATAPSLRKWSADASFRTSQGVLHETAGVFGNRAEKSGTATVVPANTVLFMDPPRAGASREFLDAVCALSPARIVYISCNPETQARDAAYLARAGYQVHKIQPVDMFPHTDHVETVASLSRAGK